MTSLEKAKLARTRKVLELQAQIKDLEVCDCNYPLVVMRNLYGHSSTCPAYERVKQRREERELNRELQNY